MASGKQRPLLCCPLLTYNVAEVISCDNCFAQWHGQCAPIPKEWIKELMHLREVNLPGLSWICPGCDQLPTSPAADHNRNTCSPVEQRPNLTRLEEIMNEKGKQAFVTLTDLLTILGGKEDPPQTHSTNTNMEAASTSALLIEGKRQTPNKGPLRCHPPQPNKVDCLDFPALSYKRLNKTQLTSGGIGNSLQPQPRDKCSSSNEKVAEEKGNLNDPRPCDGKAAPGRGRNVPRPGGNNPTPIKLPQIDSEHKGRQTDLQNTPSSFPHRGLTHVPPIDEYHFNGTSEIVNPSMALTQQMEIDSQNHEKTVKGSQNPRDTCQRTSVVEGTVRAITSNLRDPETTHDSHPTDKGPHSSGGQLDNPTLVPLLRAAERSPRVRWLFAAHLHSTTKAEDLLLAFKRENRPHPLLEVFPKPNLRNHSMAFCVKVRRDEANELMHSDIWPRGCSVDRLKGPAPKLQSKKRNTQNPLPLTRTTYEPHQQGMAKDPEELTDGDGEPTSDELQSNYEQQRMENSPKSSDSNYTETDSPRGSPQGAVHSGSSDDLHGVTAITQSSVGPSQGEDFNPIS